MPHVKGEEGLLGWTFEFVWKGERGDECHAKHTNTHCVYTHLLWQEVCGDDLGARHDTSELGQSDLSQLLPRRDALTALVVEHHLCVQGGGAL